MTLRRLGGVRPSGRIQQAATDQPPAEDHNRPNHRRWIRRAHRRAAAQFGLDSVMWLVALTSTTLARHDFNTRSLDTTGLLGMVPVALVCQLGAGLAFGLYLGRHRFGSFALRPCRVPYKQALSPVS